MRVKAECNEVHVEFLFLPLANMLWKYHNSKILASGARLWFASRGNGRSKIVANLCSQGNMWTHLVPSAYFGMALLQVCMEIAGTGDPEIQVPCGEPMLCKRLQSTYLPKVELLWMFALVAATAYAMLASFSYHLCTCSGFRTRTCAHRFDLSGAHKCYEPYCSRGGLMFRNCRTHHDVLFLCRGGGLQVLAKIEALVSISCRKLCLDAILAISSLSSGISGLNLLCLRLRLSSLPPQMPPQSPDA
eukprot:6481403-Amphidinium_carterae.1